VLRIEKINMSKGSNTIEKQGIGKFFIPSLFLSWFTMNPPFTLLSLLLIEIGLTFGLQVGTVGQINAATSLVALIASFIVGALSVRFRYKRLLMIGLVFRVLSAATCAFASSFYTMLLFFSLHGVGGALITPMTMSLTAEHLQSENRAGAIGWIIMSEPVSAIIGSLAINYLAGFGSWRLPFLTFILPINILSLIFVSMGIPSSQSKRTLSSYADMFKGFIETLTTRSALACLIGSIFSAASIGGFLVYQASFFRQRYLVSTGFASLMFIGNALCLAFGSRVAGRFIGKVGSRLLWAIAMILGGASIVLASISPNLWISLTLALMVNVQLGLALTSSNSLTLDQVPSFRGTTMSLLTAANSMGMTLGASLGGIILLTFNYGTLGLVLGSMGFLAAVIVYFWAHERT
jgi:predicted MFS family arabinose efflux permease